MSFTVRAYNTAKKLIDKYGDTITIIDRTQTAYNPNTGEYDSVEVDTPTKGVVSNFDTSEIVEGVINIDDIQVLLYAPYITPEFDFYYNGERYNVINILQRISVQDGAIIYKVQGRK